MLLLLGSTHEQHSPTPAKQYPVSEPITVIKHLYLPGDKHTMQHLCAWSMDITAVQLNESGSPAASGLGMPCLLAMLQVATTSNAQTPQ